MAWAHDDVVVDQFVKLCVIVWVLNVVELILLLPGERQDLLWKTVHLLPLSLLLTRGCLALGGFSSKPSAFTPVRRSV